MEPSFHRRLLFDDQLELRSKRFEDLSFISDEDLDLDFEFLGNCK
jgi:hypothetical protein